MTVVAVQAGTWVNAQRPGARQGVGCQHSAGDLFGTVHAIGVAGQRMHAAQTAQRHGQRQQELHVASAASVALERDGGLAAGQQHAGRLEGLALTGHLQRDAGQGLADVARFAFQAVAQDVGCLLYTSRCV